MKKLLSILTVILLLSVFTSCSKALISIDSPEHSIIGSWNLVKVTFGEDSITTIWLTNFTQAIILHEDKYAIEINERLGKRDTIEYIWDVSDSNLILTVGSRSITYNYNVKGDTLSLSFWATDHTTLCYARLH